MSEVVQTLQSLAELKIICASGQNLNLKSGQLFISFPEGLEDTPLKDSPRVSLDFGRLASKFKSGNAISLELTREVPN